MDKLIKRDFAERFAYYFHEASIGGAEDLAQVCLASGMAEA
jgi:hypothetical protein